MIFDDWQALIRVVWIGVLSYSALVVLLRISGKRTLSKWNAFDLIVTIALGSTLATVLLTQQVTLTQGVVALALLIGLQFVISWLTIRVHAVRRFTKSEPTYLYREGEFILKRLHSERVTESEVNAAVRGAGIGSMQDVEAVILETDGSVSVIRKNSAGDRSALVDVE
jgi:uncharacterized membrane protein YcaP (DUF421 family)